ncbi:MAG: hypothetical protein ACR2RF_24865 [Geminicoccaceae bacterium]
MNINEAFPSKYLKSADLDELPGKECNVLISNVTLEDVGTQDNPEQKPVVHFQGAEKGMVLNKTNAMVLESAFGPETERWVGQKVTLFSQPVMFQGRQVRGLRMRPAFEPTPQAGSALAGDPRPAPPPGDDEIPF